MNWVKIAALSMFVAVALGAFGAHGLKNRLSEEMMKIYQTAFLYQVIHSLGLFVVAWLLGAYADPKLGFAAILFLLGIFLFSGGLYALALTGQRALGAVAPLGGLCFLFGWLLIILAKLRA